MVSCRSSSISLPWIPILLYLAQLGPELKYYTLFNSLKKRLITFLSVFYIVCSSSWEENLMLITGSNPFISQASAWPSTFLLYRFQNVIQMLNFYIPCSISFCGALPEECLRPFHCEYILYRSVPGTD